MTEQPKKYIITEVGMNLAIAAFKANRLYDTAESVLKEIRPVSIPPEGAAPDKQPRMAPIGAVRIGKTSNKELDEIADESYRQIQSHGSNKAAQPSQYRCDEDDINCLNDYFMATLNGEEPKEKLLKLWQQELGVIRHSLLSQQQEPALDSLEEFTWLRYKENRICEKGIDEHCEIRSEIKRLQQLQQVPAPDNTIQCHTCKHEGKRTCMSHGYPESNIPKSCRYKLGVYAEESMRNLNGTHLDCWTKEHAAEIRVISGFTVGQYASILAIIDNGGGNKS